MNERYSRQTLFKPIGTSGQQQISEAIVTIIGCGALGSANAEMLVRAGIGHLNIIDRDYVEASNLQRQQLFKEQHVTDMVPKVVAAEQRLREIRSDISLRTYLENADGMLMERLASESDLIIDATDNFETRLLINDAAYKYGKPWIHGAVVGSSSVVFPFVPGETACFRCLLPVLPKLNQTCDTVGVIAPAVQITAAQQAAEALKYISGNRKALRKKIHYFDVWDNSSLDMGIARIKSASCETCGEAPSYPSLSENGQHRFAMLCGRDTVQVLPDSQRKLTLDDAERAAVRANGKMRRTPYFVEMHIFDHRMILFQDGRLLIHGLRDVNQGRKIYVQLFG